jgi:LysR family transcriptional regulator, nod-box dependent transcriptional activator
MPARYGQRRDSMRFNRLDLNLLVALDALLTDQNITRASERLHLSQSAMSGALARLREHFQDELLVQVGRRMTPTPLAEKLVKPVRDILAQIQATVERRPTFDPATSDRRFSLMVSDYITTVLMSNVLQRAAREAPGVSFELLFPDSAQLEILDSGEIDFLVTPREYISSEHPALDLIEETYACVVWDQNPLSASEMTFDQYLSAGHVVVRFGKMRVPSFDEWFFARFGVSRRVEVVAQSFNAVPQLLIGTQRIATMHRRLALHYQQLLPLRLLPPPIEIPKLTECIQWHKAHDSDGGIVWLRSLIKDAADRLESPPA